MRSVTLALAVLAVPAVLVCSPARAYDLPYDPYPWCAVYSGDAGGASNCGFLTIEQCRATVSGIGGSLETNPLQQPPPANRHTRPKTTNTPPLSPLFVRATLLPHAPH